MAVFEVVVLETVVLFVVALICPVVALFNVKLPEFVNATDHVKFVLVIADVAVDVYVLVPLCVAVSVGVLLPPLAAISPIEAPFGDVITGLFQESV